ncbi:MAG: hypothetical protein CMH48_14655 [Muricauda sp.]|nr:DUF3307 domain-containing protein [Allomuricauda sp.]MAU26707.1 hypothetical protein [Allomuricauda sp.]MBC32070.1 hypothetical protein [Allomuricauda sp.]|tara:strand:- start:1046 stop:1396 length:351 start_codon:yes stop_codon:yes gene_type:complete
MDFIVLLLAHWVGDYLLQTNNMALKKHHSLKWLSLHILVYTAVLLVFCNLVFSWQIALGYAVINGLLHFITDFFTSKLAAKYHGKRRIFYSILGFDQFVHMVCLYWAYVNADILAL